MDRKNKKKENQKGSPRDSDNDSPVKFVSRMNDPIEPHDNKLSMILRDNNLSMLLNKVTKSTSEIRFNNYLSNASASEFLKLDNENVVSE